MASLIRLDPPEAVRVRPDMALDAYLAAQRVNAERPES